MSSLPRVLRAALGCAGLLSLVACGRTDWKSAPSEPTLTPWAPQVTAPDVSRGAKIRVLVAFTQEAAADEPDFASRANEWLLFTNDVLAQSGVSHQLELGAVQALGSLHEDVSLDDGDWEAWMTTSLADHTSDLAKARELAAADLVVLVGHFGDRALIQTAGADPTEPARAGALVGLGDDAEWSFAHQIGHLLGAGHDAITDGRVSGFHYGYYVTADAIATLMAATASCGASCSNVPYLSNPHLTIHGHAYGVREEAFNACTAERAGTYVASFYEVAYGLTPYATANLATYCD